MTHDWLISFTARTIPQGMPYWGEFFYLGQPRPTIEDLPAIRDEISLNLEGQAESPVITSIFRLGDVDGEND